MDIRAIHSEELQAFSHVSERYDLNTALETYLSALWKERASRPEWCFVAQPSFPLPQEIDFLDVPWTGPYLKIGEALLRQTLTQFHTQGADLMKCAITSPSRLQQEPEKYQSILIALGFELRRESDRWQTYDLTPHVSPRTNSSIVLSATLEWRRSAIHFSRPSRIALTEVSSKIVPGWGYKKLHDNA